MEFKKIFVLRAQTAVPGLQPSMSLSRRYTFLSSILTSYSLYINFCDDNFCWQQFDTHELHLKQFRRTEAWLFPGTQMLVRSLLVQEIVWQRCVAGYQSFRNGTFSGNITIQLPAHVMQHPWQIKTSLCCSIILKSWRNCWDTALIKKYGASMRR
jgi:hypothetical protein